AEIGQEGPPLTLHARYASEDNNILRSGMKGARHRYQQVGLTGNRNNFRRSQARVITYTEFVIGCQVEGVISALGTRILLNGVSGELGSQYAIARFPFPREPVSSFTVRVDPAEGAGKLSLRFRRWGDEKAVISNVQDTDVTFSDGELPFPLQIVDGNETQPTLSVLKIVIDPTLEPEGQTSLTLSGVQHGDVLILEETSSGATVSLAVVKNFSSNDLQRLHNAGFDLSIAEPFDVSAKCSGALIAVAKFILDVEAGSSQSAQREAFLVSMRDKFSEGDLDSSKAFPCALEIPSAFGIGMFPDDASHFHLASSVEQSDDLLKSIEAVQSSILAAADAKGLSHFTDPSAESSSYRNSCQEHHDETSATLAEMLTLATDAGHGIHIWHSYERVSTLYADPVGQKPLWPGDPIRNIMCSVDGNPELFEPPDLGAAAWGEMFSDVFNEIGLFVDRRARIVPYYFSSRPDSESLESDVSYNEALQVADAVAALEDGGSVPPDASL
ncbi:MAG TPA: hypothetical protein VN638_02675, partial [Nitrospiraceae bacterium]|nr:hypothetical protein [Nitrospiraceae bacterium]